MMTHVTKRLAASAWLLTVLAGCAGDPGPSQSIDHQTDVQPEAQTALPPLVTCQADVAEDDSEYVTCQLASDLPVDVSSAKLDVSHRSGGTGATLTREEPSRTFSIPGLVSEVEIARRGAARHERGRGLTRDDHRRG